MLSGGEAAEAVAIGVPDARLGRAIVVVARASGDASEVEARLRERLRQELPSFMQPRRYEWVSRDAAGMRTAKLDRVAPFRSRGDVIEADGGDTGGIPR